VLENNERVCCFHQDGLTAHTAKTTTTDFLHYFFCDGVVGRRLWLTQLPDIMPDDFYFCGYFLQKESTVIGLAQEVWRILITF